MGRQVSITLRGTLEELPAEVAEFLVVTLRSLGSVERKLNSVVERLEQDHEIDHCVVDLDGIRQSLFKIDNRLDDCGNILTAYLENINNGTPTSPPASDGEE